LRAGTLLWVLLAGVLQAPAWVVPSAWPLSLLAMAVLAAALDGASWRRAALLAWVFGTASLCANTWWLFISMYRYGGLPAPLAAGAVLLLSGFLSLYGAFTLAMAARWRRGRISHDAAHFAGAWLLAELARGVFFTGFPWAALGYSQVDGPLALLAPLVGVYGMGAVAAGLAACLGLAVVRHGDTPSASDDRSRGAMVAVVPLALLAAWATWVGPPGYTQPTGTLKVGLLQPNVPQDEKFAAEHLPDTLGWVAAALTQTAADLVVAPETAVPLLPDQLREFSPDYWPALQQHFGQAQGPRALVGVPLGDFSHGYSNSVVGLSNGPAYRYDKTHLVPFGEFIPTGFRWFTELMNIPLGDFDRGPLNPPSFAVQGERVAPNICYEDLFGEELARRFGQAATAPTVMANVSNIGWFGQSVAVPQHLAISRLRSLEFQRPMVRATNTGATAVIDHQGVVTARLAPFTQAVLQATVQGRQGNTPFATWAAAWGLTPLWLLGALAWLWPRHPLRMLGLAR